MEIKHLTNPKHFASEASKNGVYYELLEEAVICCGKQRVSKMFNGKSERENCFCISPATLESWIKTLKFLKDNPDHIDSQRVQSRDIRPKKEWYDYVDILKTEIPEKEIKLWNDMSGRQLIANATRWGYTFGTKTYGCIQELRTMMNDMVKRRKENIWGKQFSEIEIETDYDRLSIYKLRDIAKEKKLTIRNLSKKDLITKILAYEKGELPDEPPKRKKGRKPKIESINPLTDDNERLNALIKENEELKAKLNQLSFLSTSAPTSVE